MQKQEGASLSELSDLCTPWCVHVAATLRIADHIAAGVDEINPLASAAGCDADSLSRVLRHLVGKGVFQETEPGRFALNETARELLDPSQRLALDLGGIGGRMAYAWGTLLKSVRTGAPAYHELFGRPFWEDLDAHPEIAASFDALMGMAGFDSCRLNWFKTGVGFAHSAVDQSSVGIDGDWCRVGAGQSTDSSAFPRFRE